MSIVSHPTLYDSLAIQTLAESIHFSSRGLRALRSRQISPALYEIIHQTNGILTACLAPTGTTPIPSGLKTAHKTDQEFWAEGMRKAAETIACLIHTRKLGNHQLITKLIDNSLKNLNEVEARYKEDGARVSRPLDLYRKILEELPRIKSLINTLVNEEDSAPFYEFISLLNQFPIETQFFSSNTKKYYAMLNKNSDLKTDLIADLLKNIFDLLFIAGGFSSLATYQPDAIFSQVRMRLEQFIQKSAHLEPNDLQSFQIVAGYQVQLLDVVLNRIQAMRNSKAPQEASFSDSASADALPQKRKLEEAYSCSPSESAAPEPKRFAPELPSSSSPAIPASPLQLPTQTASIEDLFIDLDSSQPIDEIPSDNEPLVEFNPRTSPFFPLCLSPSLTGEADEDLM